MTAPQFEALLALQTLDTDLDRARYRRDHLAARAVLAEVGAARAALAARRAPLEAARDEVAGRQEALEEDLAHTEGRIKEVSDRLYGGGVQASRDLQAMAADIEVLKARASHLEDRVLAVLDEREPLDAELEATDAEAAGLDRREQEAQAELVRGQADADAELAVLASARAEASSAVPAGLAATYERLRTRLGGIGAARLEGSRCGGCHLDLSATELDALHHLPPEELAFCDQCGRILVRP